MKEKNLRRTANVFWILIILIIIAVVWLQFGNAVIFYCQEINLTGCQ